MAISHGFSSLLYSTKNSVVKVKLPSCGDTFASCSRGSAVDCQTCFSSGFNWFFWLYGLFVKCIVAANCQFVDVKVPLHATPHSNDVALTNNINVTWLTLLWWIQPERKFPKPVWKPFGKKVCINVKFGQWPKTLKTTNAVLQHCCW